MTSGALGGWINDTCLNTKKYQTYLWGDIDGLINDTCLCCLSLSFLTSDTKTLS